MRRFIVPITLFLSLQGLHACGGYSCNNPSITFNGAFGVSSYSSALNREGEAALGKLSLGMMIYRENLGFGIEGGIQSGNTMHLKFSNNDLFILGGVPLEVQIKPMLDISVNFQMRLNEDFFGIVKGGVVFRQMQINEEALNDLRDIAPKIEAGFGYQLSEQLVVNLMYQYIFGKAPVLSINPVMERGFLANIPSSQALMLGVSYNF